MALRSVEQQISTQLGTVFWQERLDKAGLALARQSSGVAVLEVAEYAWLNPFGHEEF